VASDSPASGKKSDSIPLRVKILKDFDLRKSSRLQFRAGICHPNHLTTDLQEFLPLCEKMTIFDVFLGGRHYL
jgi:hypothetical protein